MSPCVVFNELSASQPEVDAATGNRRITDWFQIALDQRLGRPKTLVTPLNFLQLLVSNGVSVGRWLKVSRELDPDTRNRIKLLVSKSIDFAKCLNVAAVDEDEDVEYKYMGRECRGLAVAGQIDGLALSLQSVDEWDATSIMIEKSWCTDNDVLSSDIDIRHASTLTHLDHHQAWLDRQRRSAPDGGEALWVHRAELFPSLEFCAGVKSQVARLSKNDPSFKKIFRGLQDLQRFCDSWDAPHFDIHKLGKASGESPTTLNMYSTERTFLCPDGESRVFQWHLKRGDLRIHFFDFPETKKLLVGYLGAHLRIATG